MPTQYFCIHCRVRESAIWGACALTSYHKTVKSKNKSRIDCLFMFGSRHYCDYTQKSAPHQHDFHLIFMLEFRVISGNESPRENWSQTEEKRRGGAFKRLRDHMTMLCEWEMWVPHARKTCDRCGRRRPRSFPSDPHLCSHLHPISATLLNPSYHDSQPSNVHSNAFSIPHSFLVRLCGFQEPQN